MLISLFATPLREVVAVVVLVIIVLVIGAGFGFVIGRWYAERFRARFDMQSIWNGRKRYRGG